MLLFFGVIAGALIVAVVIGGDVRRLSQVHLVRPVLLVIAFGFKAAVALLGLAHSSAAVAVAKPLNLIGGGLLLVVVWLNQRIPGALIFGGGLSLNLLALASFGGRMPVLVPDHVREGSPALALLKSGLDPLHVVLTTPRGLWFLGDIFTIPGLSGHASVVSIGDLLMATGVAWLIIRCSQQPRRRPQEKPLPPPLPSPQGGGR